jgi:hypothetical protein
MKYASMTHLLGGSNLRAVTLGLGVVLLVLGGIWFLQGVGILPGSFMTGQLFWAGAGVVCILAGGFLVLRGRTS